MVISWTCISGAGFSFDWFLIAILKCIGFGDRRAKEFEVSKCSVLIFVLFLIEKCVVKYLGRSQFSPSC